MIEFTILLDDTDLYFEPLRSDPDLALILPPTARIGRERADQDVVHLAPIPVHCFFNAMTFGKWLASEYGLSERDAFSVYIIHDMFKSFLRLIPSARGRQWWHQYDVFFAPLRGDLQSAKVFDDFPLAFRVASRHSERRGRRTLVPWREAVAYEKRVSAGIEESGRSWEWDWTMMGLSIRLQLSLSNALSIAYVKRLFIKSYVEAIRAEYPDVFARFDAVSYEYEFVDPATLSGNRDKDIEMLSRQSKVEQKGRSLLIRTFIGAYGSHWRASDNTVIKLPFWLLLTLQNDPVSMLFPVPMLYGSDGSPANNPAFVKRVRDNFYKRVQDLLLEVKLNKVKQEKWYTQVDEIMENIDQVFPIVHTADFDQAVSTRQFDTTLNTQTCSMCGSPIPLKFACSPKRDLGASVSNYTDWHLGDADQACVLCAISQFKVPEALKPAKKLIFQRKAVYFSVSTPSARESDMHPATLPLSDVASLIPKLDIRSLESLVTLNIVAALYLYDVRHRSVLHYKEARDLWLEETFPTSPFSFVGEVAKAKSKRRMPAFMGELLGSINRQVTLLDPLLPMEIEIPFHALACLLGVSKGRHFEFKYKPLIVSNETGMLPVIWEGYHLVNSQTLNAIQTFEDLVSAFRSRRVSDRMKLTALASAPEEFIEVLVGLGSFNYENILTRLDKLSGEMDSEEYLRYLGALLRQTPLITELWR